MKKQAETETELMVYVEPELVSLKDIGSYIEGIYQGVALKEDKQGNKLVCAYFQDTQDENLFRYCIAGTQLKKFLTNFKKGYYLKVTKIGSIEISGGKKFSKYEFQFSPLGFTQENNLLDVSSLQF